RQKPLQQVGQGLARPVQILDDEDDRLRTSKSGDEVDPLCAQKLRSTARVEVGADVEPQCEAENVASSQLFAHRLGRVALERPQLLLAPDERGLEWDSTRPAGRDHANEFTAHDATRLPLRLDGPRVSELKGRTDGGHRSLTNQDLTGERYLLEPRRDIDGI